MPISNSLIEDVKVIVASLQTVVLETLSDLKTAKGTVLVTGVGFPELIKRALNRNLSGKEIKKAIQHWRGGNERVKIPK